MFHSKVIFIIAVILCKQICGSATFDNFKQLIDTQDEHHIKQLLPQSDLTKEELVKLTAHAIEVRDKSKKFSFFKGFMVGINAIFINGFLREFFTILQARNVAFTSGNQDLIRKANFVFIATLFMSPIVPLPTIYILATTFFGWPTAADRVVQDLLIDPLKSEHLPYHLPYKDEL